MKKVGVPLTPLRTPPVKSPRTFALYFPSSSALLQIRRGELQFLGESQVEVIAQAILVFKKQIVHLPEFAMGARKLGCLRRGLGVRMQFIQREIPEDKAQALPEVLLDLLDDRISVPTMGAFIIPILDQRAWRRRHLPGRDPTGLTDTLSVLMKRSYFGNLSSA